jgi:hypothetical protein
MPMTTPGARDDRLKATLALINSIEEVRTSDSDLNEVPPYYTFEKGGEFNPKARTVSKEFRAYQFQKQLRDEEPLVEGAVRFIFGHYTSEDRPRVQVIINDTVKRRHVATRMTLLFLEEARSNAPQRAPD